MDTYIQNNILEQVQGVVPFDEMEQTQIADTIQWIQSGVQLFRIQKPDVPPKHLVSYFVVIDPTENKILLVDHIKAQRWLPPGGHVELNEHPKNTVERELIEELGMVADFLFNGIFFITQTVTGGLTPGHTDVSLWYVVKGNSRESLYYDVREFKGYQWFGYDELLQTPIQTLDPHMHRFVKKWMTKHH